MATDRYQRWFCVAVASHLAWGCHPVLLTWLVTQCNLPPFALAASGNVVVMLLLLLLPATQVPVARWAELLRIRDMQLLALFVVLRSLSDIVVASLTSPVYVQLMTLMAPFILALLTQVPLSIIPALVLSTVGGAMVVLGGAEQLQPGSMAGVALALISAGFHAAKMVLIRKLTREHALEGELVLLTMTAPLVLISLCGAVVWEEWPQWTSLRIVDWLVFIGYAFAIRAVAQVAQIYAVRSIGPAIVTSLLPTRLLATVGCEWVLLHSSLKSPIQAAGIVVVLITLTIHLRQDAHATLNSPFRPPDNARSPSPSPPRRVNEFTPPRPGQSV